jgi:hypothetical protein
MNEKLKDMLGRVTAKDPFEARLLPEELFTSTRAMNATTATAGGFTVPETIQVADALRPFSVGVQAGMQVETMLFNGKIANVALRLFQRDLFGAVGQAYDVALFSGTGGVEPLGLCFNDDIEKPVTFGGAPALSDATEFEESLADNHAEVGSIAFVTSPAARKKWRETEGITGSGVPLWGNDNRILGRPALASPCVSGNLMLYGNWNDILVTMFGPITFIIDPYGRKKENIVELYCELRADLAPIRNKSMSRSTDSAAQ